MSSRTMDVSNGILVLSQSQKASIVEGVGEDIDIGVYDMTANNVISSSLKSSNGGGLLYTNNDGQILSMNNVLSYDATSNKIDLMSSRTMDVSNGILVLSQSQKASIVEGVGEDIDIGPYKLFAEGVELYKAIDDGNPSFKMGASEDESLVISAIYEDGTQTLDKVLVKTFSGSSVADKGKIEFSIDETSIVSIDDEGINLFSSKALLVADTEILSDNSGSMTLSNIDLLDSTTKSTIESAIDSLGTIGSGVWQGTAIDTVYGGTGLSSVAKGSVLVANGDNAITALDGGGASNGILFYTSSTDTISWSSSILDANVADALTVNGGTVDNTIIGGSTPAAGKFTTLNAGSTGAEFTIAETGTDDITITNTVNEKKINFNVKISASDTTIMTLDGANGGSVVFEKTVTVASGGNDFDISSHDGSNGLKLGGTLVEATAAELNLLAGPTDLTTIAGLSCANGQILKRIADAWACAADSTQRRRLLDSDTETGIQTDNAVFSDKRLKTNIQTIENASNKLKLIRGVTYNFDTNVHTKAFKKLPKTEQVGVIAQEVERVLPQLVTETGDGIKKVDYVSLTAFLIQVNKEQEIRLDSQEKKIQNIEKAQKYLIHVLYGICSLCIFMFAIAAISAIFYFFNKNTVGGEKTETEVNM